MPAIRPLMAGCRVLSRDCARNTIRDSTSRAARPALRYCSGWLALRQGAVGGFIRRPIGGHGLPEGLAALAVAPGGRRVACFQLLRRAKSKAAAVCGVGQAWG